MYLKSFSYVFRDRPQWNCTWLFCCAHVRCLSNRLISILARWKLSRMTSLMPPPQNRAKSQSGSKVSNFAPHS